MPRPAAPSEEEGLKSALSADPAEARMPAYVYEIPTRKYREERVWGTEKEARTALKHVARRAVQTGASNEDLVILIEIKTNRTIFEGTIAAALKG
jgi:hypothetical protein